MRLLPVMLLLAFPLVAQNATVAEQGGPAPEPAAESAPEEEIPGLPPPAERENPDAPPIGPLVPVPLPTDADLQLAEEIKPAQPQSVALDFAAGFDYVKDTQTLTSRGGIRAKADTGMTLTAAGGHYLGAERKLYLSGPVHLKTETGVEVFSNQAVLDDAARSVTLLGDVSVYQNRTLQRGQRIVYWIDSGKLDVSELRTGVYPLLLESGGFAMEERNGKRVFVGRDAAVTTHDDEDPDYWLRADEITVYPEDRVTFENLRLYLGQTPVFWLPYFSQPLDAQLGYHLVPGSRSNWGPYLLNSYGLLLGGGDDPWLLSRWNLDFRARRGVGAGVDLLDRREKNRNLTGLSLYYTPDSDPTISRNGLPRGIVSRDRWRAAFQYRVPLGLESDDRWRLDFNLNLLSDDYFLQDFEPDLYREDPAPDNTIGLARRGEHSLFSLYTRMRANDFYRTDARSPEIAFDQSAQSLFGSPLFHEGSSSFAVMEERIGSFNQGLVQAALLAPAGSPQLPVLLGRLPYYERSLVQKIRALAPGSPLRPAMITQLVDPGFNRLHTFQRFSAPMKLGGWLNLVPEVGGGFSHYGSVNGPLSSENRAFLYLGGKASVKFSRDYGDRENRPWGLEGLLHVVQPYVGFSHLVTNDLNPLFPIIDREGYSTRPRTLIPTRFTAIDELNDWSILRFGVRNDLITRRDGQSHQWLSLDTYMDGYFRDPERLGRNFSNLYNDLTWRPLPWMDVALETQFPLLNSGSKFSEVSAVLRFMPMENLEFAIANRFLKNHPILDDSNRVDMRAFARLSERWGLGVAHVWEMEDGTLEFQQYSLHHNFGHWVGSLGVTSRDNRLKREFGIFLALSLKDFPNATLPVNLDAQ